MSVLSFLIFLFIHENSISTITKYVVLSYICEIKIIINGKGNHLIYNDNQNSYNFELPTDLYINGNSETVKPRHYLNEKINVIKLIWQYDLYNANELFKDCSNISEIDL